MSLSNGKGDGLDGHTDYIHVYIYTWDVSIRGTEYLIHTTYIAYIHTYLGSKYVIPNLVGTYIQPRYTVHFTASKRRKE